MPAIHALIWSNALVAWGVLAVSFVVLARCADLFVESSVAVARKLRIPRIIIGIVLVSLATTMPELSVSLMAAIRGRPEMALGNAIGSVICDDGLALGLAGLTTVSVIPILPGVLRISGFFLLLVEVVLFLFVIFDNTLNRWEGVLLLALFAGYLCVLFRQYAKGTLTENINVDEHTSASDKPLIRALMTFALGLAGVILAGEFIVTSATAIAHSFDIPESVIALTLVAFGTSIPEVATCITAARKNEGAIAVGNIIGADVMNICWVAGASAVANDLTLGTRELWFMFPSMFIIVGAMLVLLWTGYKLTRREGAVLLGLYLIYLGSFVVIFRR